MSLSQRLALLTSLACCAGPWIACSGSCAGAQTEAAVETEAAEAAEAPSPVEATAAALEGSAEPVPPPPPPPPPPPSCDLGVPDGSGGCIVTPADRRGAMSDEERAAHLRDACPDPELGSFAESWTWDAPEGELALAAIDLLGEATTFDLLSDFEGTSILFRVREAETRDKLAVIKTTSSNTRVDAEVYAHRLSVLLGFDELVPDVLHTPIAGGAAEKLIELLNSVRYDDENKERRRQRVIRQVRASMEEGEEPFMGAMKPWLRGFMFHSGLGHRESLAESDVMYFLRDGRPQPTDEVVRLRQYTRLYEPLGTHQGRLQMWQLAEDLSNILLLDALVGQNDRFPGGNLHFMSVTQTEEVVGERRGRPIYDMGDVRLLALDNGAALHDDIGSGIRDLRGDIVRGTRVERFERDTIERLEGLGRRLMGRGCEVAPFDDEVDAIWSYLGLHDPDDREMALGYLERVYAYLDELADDADGAIYIEPVLTPEGSGEGSGAAEGETATLRAIDGEETLPPDADAEAAAAP